MIEIWKPIKNTRRYYFISNRGRVKDKFGKIIKQQITKGYKHYNLQSKKYLTIHTDKTTLEYFNDYFYPNKYNIFTTAYDMLKLIEKNLWIKFKDIPGYYFDSIIYFINIDNSFILNEDSTEFKKIKNFI